MAEPVPRPQPTLTPDQWNICQMAATLLAGNSAIYHGRAAEAHVARVVELAYAIVQEVGAYPAVDFDVGASQHYSDGAA